MNSMKAIVLLQLGTPDSPTTKDCRKFLREFLSDPRVVDIPRFLRFLLVELIIAPFRSPKSAEAYQKIWTPKGSPLRVYSESLTQKIQAQFKGSAEVRLAMRYGAPRFSEVWKELRLKGCTEILLVPLYPQYASASTGTALEDALTCLQKEEGIPAIHVFPPFYKEDFYIECMAQRAANFDLKSYDHILFSFHGLPERQIQKTDLSAQHCLRSADCCHQETQANRFCYRAQSFQTASRLAMRLGIASEKWTLCFQSRLGRTPWIRPFTDHVIEERAKKGDKRLLVFSPSFVADCLETLEEIQMRSQESFLELGGAQLDLVPSLNDEDSWAKSLSDALRKFI